MFHTLFRTLRVLIQISSLPPHPPSKVVKKHSPINTTMVKNNLLSIKECLTLLITLTDTDAQFHFMKSNNASSFFFFFFFLFFFLLFLVFNFYSSWKRGKDLKFKGMASPLLKMQGWFSEMIQNLQRTSQSVKLTVVIPFALLSSIGNTFLVNFNSEDFLTKIFN